MQTLVCIHEEVVWTVPSCFSVRGCVLFAYVFIFVYVCLCECMWSEIKIRCLLLFSTLSFETGSLPQLSTSQLWLARDSGYPPVSILLHSEALRSQMCTRGRLLTWVLNSGPQTCMTVTVLTEASPQLLIVPPRPASHLPPPVMERETLWE